MKRKVFMCAVVSALLWQAGSVQAELPPLIPRDVLFGNPDKVSPKISPDGARLAYLAPSDIRSWNAQGELLSRYAYTNVNLRAQLTDADFQPAANGITPPE